MKLHLAALAALSVTSTAAAQGNPAIAPLYEMTKGWLVKSAEMMPEADYSFKPTPAVRSYGALVGHLADANFLMCATAKGEASPHAMGEFEKKTTKAELIQGLKDALAYCDPVYKMADAELSAPAEVFGIKMTRLGFAFLNVTHDNLHYGNLITYLRLKGLTPPSSPI
ncbi:MAG TPA: DinB family protein [Gemmatimonadales bacterium]|jgi:uncharacterized damage-inducible protein DinB|nr:DinB family protein [Gemmatimonadales bacterium]